MASEWGLSAASGLVAPLLVDYLVKPTERRIRYLFRFHLAAKETQVKEDVEEAKLQIRTQVIYDQVDEWLTKAENALKDVKVLDSKIEENKRCFRLCPNWCWRYQLSQEIKNKALEIADLLKKSEFKRVGHRAKLPNLDLVTSKDHVDLKSSDAAFNKIMEALKDDKVKKIGVWGMGGVGETTLIRNVSGEVKGFDRVIMVTVSETLDIEKIQNKIADDIDLNFEKKTEEGKASELWSRLADGKFLVILDDLWKEWNDDEDLRKIGIPLVKDEKGCKIILTTRNYNVCQHMECDETVQVKVLEDDKAWTLFGMNAGLKKADSRANSIEKMRNEVLSVIDHLRDCYLLEDGDDGSYMTLFVMLLYGLHQKKKVVLIIVRDVALWIASEEKSGFMIKSRLELLNKSSKSCKAISLLDSEEKNLPDGLALSKLEILLLKNCDVQGTCFLRMRELKVLSLTIADGSSAFISLYALTFLPNLRALHLENFKDFSFLRNLRTLEILSLHASISENLAD
ncbi:disease resistance protein [Gossypium australe]|uniref:Disease resistance protein n=1 Tax=Gossypium australe TaxID=47621 RepID=A0A5B6VF54_9ROSI|nr:disease resistance protein [Gossypium australe]